MAFSVKHQIKNDNTNLSGHGDMTRYASPRKQGHKSTYHRNASTRTILFLCASRQMKMDINRIGHLESILRSRVSDAEVVCVSLHPRQRNLPALLDNLQAQINHKHPRK